MRPTSLSETLPHVGMAQSDIITGMGGKWGSAKGRRRAPQVAHIALRRESQDCSPYGRCLQAFTQLSIIPLSSENASPSDSSPLHSKNPSESQALPSHLPCIVNIGTYLGADIQAQSPYP